MIMPTTNHNASISLKGLEVKIDTLLEYLKEIHLKLDCILNTQQPQSSLKSKHKPPPKGQGSRIRKRDAKLLSYLSDNWHKENITNKELSEACTFPESEVANILRRLKNNGEITIKKVKRTEEEAKDGGPRFYRNFTICGDTTKIRARSYLKNNIPADKRAEQLLEIIKNCNNENIKDAELSDLMKCSVGSIQKYLKVLKKQNKIRCFLRSEFLPGKGFKTSRWIKLGGKDFTECFGVVGTNAECDDSIYDDKDVIASPEIETIKEIVTVQSEHETKLMPDSTFKVAIDKSKYDGVDSKTREFYENRNKPLKEPDATLFDENPTLKDLEIEEKRRKDRELVDSFPTYKVNILKLFSGE